MLPYLCQVIASLDATQLFELSSKFHQYRQAFVWRSDLEPLLWLDAQSLYPKCYWQSRDSQEAVIALGKLAEFNNIRKAESCLQDEQRVWGGSAFHDKKNDESYFFLPLLELVRVGEQWTLNVNLKGKISLLQKALASLSFKFPPFFPQYPRILCKKHLPDFAQWSDMVTHALAEIESTPLRKVVLARKTTLKLSSPISAAALLHASRQANENHFHFLLAIDQKQCFIGSTPERLCLREGNAFYTEALAGSIGRGANTKEDEILAQWLLHDKKSVYENQLVVEDIIARLSAFCTLTIAPDLRVNRLRHILHLRHLIQGKLDSNKLSDGLLTSALIIALQPTAAIAGLPRQQALQHILLHEPFERGWYSGTVGFMSQIKSEFCVAIRSALIVAKQIHFYAGAGIVPGSIATLEWAELDKKIATLLDLLCEKITKQGMQA